MAAVIFLTILIGIYITTYILNNKTPKPEGCEELAECSACHNFTCSHHTAHKKEEVEDGN